MGIENIKVRNSSEFFGDTRTGEINAANKAEVAKKILASIGYVNKRDENVVKSSREAVVAAYNDTSSNEFHKIGAALAGQLYETANRQGFARKFLLKTETQPGADIRMDVKFPCSVAVTAVSPIQVQTKFLRDKIYYPASVDMVFRCMISKQEIARASGDIVSEKLQEGLAAIEVQEDRLWKKSVDALVGVMNPSNILASGLNPSTLAIMRNEVGRWNLPVANILAASDVLNDLLGSNDFSSWFDPVTQYEIVQTGNLGTLLGMEIITDAYRAPTLKVLEQGDIYIISEPEYHGGFADRGPVESTELNGAITGENARGWFMAETIAMLVHNARSFAKGVRTNGDL